MDEEVDLSGRAKSHKQLFEEQARLSVQVSPSVPRKIFNEQDGEVDISGKARSKRDMFEKIASENRATSPVSERKFLGDVDLSGRARAHRNIFQQKIQEDAEVKTSRKMHLEEDVFSGKASSRKAMFEKFAAGEPNRERRQDDPEEERVDLSGRARSHKEKFEVFAMEASKVKTAEAKTGDLNLSGKAMAHKEFFDEKVIDAATVKTSEKKLLDDEEDAIAGRARLQKMSFEAKAAQDLEVQTCDKSRLEEVISNKGSTSVVVSSFEAKQNESFVKDRGDDTEFGAHGVAKVRRSGSKGDGSKKKKGKQDKEEGEHKKRKKRRSSSKSKDHREDEEDEKSAERKDYEDNVIDHKTYGAAEEEVDVEERENDLEKHGILENVGETLQIKLDNSLNEIQGEDSGEVNKDMNIAKHVEKSDEECEEQGFKVGGASEVKISAVVETSQSYAPVSNSHVHKDAQITSVTAKPKTAATEMKADGGASVPMDYRARRALRKRQKSMEQEQPTQGD